MKFLTFCLWIGSLMLCGCKDITPVNAKRAQPNAHTAESLSNQTLVSSTLQYQLKIVLPEKGIPVSEYFDLHVEVSTSLEQPLPFPIELEFDAGMAAHNHGMNTRPEIVRLENGRFHIKQLLFHMPGQWNLEFRILRGLVSETIKLDVQVTP